jgi:hypothetical protein
MRAEALAITAACALACAALAGSTRSTAAVQQDGNVERIGWDDVSPLRHRLEAKGITSGSFASYIDMVRGANARRVREGDLDHLVFYLLQSTRFTPLPSIEPAISAKALVDSLDARGRELFLRDPDTAVSRIPAPVRSRVAALMRALDSRSSDPRLAYFRELVTGMFPGRRNREAALLREYLRVMRFVYEKEFVAQRSARAPEAVAELYRTRGLSTDTAVEAGYLVHMGLGVIRSLEPGRRVRRVLIVGPGLDLAPRTALRDAAPLESYQPWAVIDALLSLRLSQAGDLDVVAADINPRVVEHLRRSAREPPTLVLVSEVQESDTVTLSPEYRAYFAELGRAIGTVEDAASSIGGAKGRLRKTVRIQPASARAVRAAALDIVTERLEGPAFDLVVATNILPYFDDAELMLAASNIAWMLAPGGVFLHNEARPLVGDVTSDLGFPLQQARTAVIAAVRGTPAPLYDSIFIHVKAASPAGSHRPDSSAH